MYLELKNLTVDFNGFLAVHDVNMGIEKGETRVIIGPNGAGKTTIIDMITGKTKPTKGQILLNGEDIAGKDSYDISNSYGIGRKFQGPNVFDEMSVYENLEVALCGHTSLWSAFTYRRTPEIYRQLNEILEQIDLTEQREMLPRFLSHGQRQWLEMGMILAQNPDIITLDEPAAGMTDDETFKTGEMIKSIMKDKTVIVVEHDMDFIKQIAKTVTVLNQGEILAEGTYDEVSHNAEVIRVYLKSDDEEEEA
ncbi:urea ABC transporter ATP-binding protein [Megasphaera cerevisiae DSM 20462]|jgi:urea transport system ATP-binding protein|uniref:Urea ABC transporter ATP-binding protein n=1 Tax=Megasphaera cerevisiae DSM 20462 TaxID=1122219 RepID=A0A0J6WUN1_9FIRM|nr:urea ABC transporter ATP-binding protein UrtD [Megasphaera cerevisiae]KMO85893.1 urea ABC transporter ATP-binding protein [Megasphaera cerevisiae DSM 20462]MCI1750223.1 urea ABC transporter ATP-binding protein UrtD [Megasphaera cerevisiae]OKY52796.1 urea ABC transporter ATP-binding protein UrtD [Megasphaera cerevisiae]SKA07417.1 urea transport system ATP-binding protein [Megasphaera cerevisiae DSM 20462]